MNEPLRRGLPHAVPFLWGAGVSKTGPACLPRSYPGRGAGRASALAAPSASGFLGALLATEQRASRAGGNSPRHGLGAARDRRWGDAEIDRQIALPSPGPRPHLSHAAASPERLRPAGLLPLGGDRGPLPPPSAVPEAPGAPGSLPAESDFAKGHTGLPGGGVYERNPSPRLGGTWGDCSAQNRPRGGALALRVLGRVSPAAGPWKGTAALIGAALCEGQARPGTEIRRNSPSPRRMAESRIRGGMEKCRGRRGQLG